VHELSYKSKDEIGDIASSTNTLIEGLSNTAHFAKEIGQGNMSAEYESISDQDVLGNALIGMRESLLKAKNEEELRREKEEEQKWATVGHAKFGELLRNNTDNMETFTNNVVSNLVKYTESNQGAMFLLDQEDEHDQYLTMSACYAYDRKKYVNKRVEIGENLVGQCYLEGEKILMTDVPENYVHITSGLGDANPRSLLLVPLKFNDNVYGVIELASFNKYQDFQIDFIEKVAESIASTISSVRVNIRTIKLLEESKLKSEELAAQEEEMRQNMEELQTTQEESARRELEMNGILNALNSSYLVAELDLDGNILTINDNALELLGLAKNDAEGHNMRSFLKPDELEEFENLWNNVLNGRPMKRQSIIERSKGKIVLTESYTPIFDDMDELYKILNIGIEVNPISV
jgi:PAS domain S-box-containing protein